MSFFETFFAALGQPLDDPNQAGEVAVLCPFEHKAGKGREKTSSAHVNPEKGVFHCFTCQGLGRFSQGGLSEIGFVQHYYKLSYQEAVKNLEIMKKADLNNIPKGKEALYSESMRPWLEWLQHERGLELATIDRYDIFLKGNHISYPVYFNGIIVDVREYNKDYKETGGPKIQSQSGTTSFLFPYDHWVKDDRPTLLCAGENDTLLARQNGFNAVTTTGGEGGFPRICLRDVPGRDIYICYDCDDPGKTAAGNVGYILKEAGANVFIIDLGLPGTKDSKDLSDFFLRKGKSPADLLKLMQTATVYDEALYKREKDKRYPLVDLWEVYHGQYSDRYLSSRVMVAGKFSQPLNVPVAAKATCHYDSENDVCKDCPFKEVGGFDWHMEQDHLKDLLYLAEESEKEQKKQFMENVARHVTPFGCPGVKSVRFLAKAGVTKMIFTPDVETEDETTSFQSVDQYAYVLERVVNGSEDMQDGQRYRIFYKRCEHPKKEQHVVLVVDRAEDSDNSLNTFRMTPRIYDRLKVFQGNPFEMMKDRAERMHDIVKVFKPNPMIAHCVDLMYHSPLRIKFNQRELKGYPEILVFGEERTGKTETALLFQRHVKIGNFVPVKGATVAGLVGGAEKMPNGSFRITWGTIPRNHKGLVILDEMSGIPQETLAALTSVRSEGIATAVKIVKGQVPANTRMYWTSNPRVNQRTRQSRHVRDYPNGIVAALELIGAAEDVARFDVLLLVEYTGDSSPLDVPEKPAHPPELYRDLVYWAWSRTSDQIIFSPEIEAYIVQVAHELNEQFHTNVKIFGPEAWKRVARIAVACAGACFSSDESGELLIVKKEHVDWASAFLVHCYDNDLFRLGDYVREYKETHFTDPASNLVIAGLCRSHPTIIRTLYRAVADISMTNLQTIANLEKNPFSEIINKMAKYRLITLTDSGGVRATRKFRAAVDEYKKDYEKEHMTPLGGGKSL